jgi:hypothetical protein
MMVSVIFSLSFLLSSHFVEKERIGTEIFLSYSYLEDFHHSYGGGVKVIFVTDDNLGGSLGFSLLRNSGESLYREILSGFELTSATSSKYITYSGLELNYTFGGKKISPLLGGSINWVYFHEQSKFIYRAPGWIVTTWRNNHASGYGFTALFGCKYLIAPNFSLFAKVEVIKGSVHYPPIHRNLQVEGISLSVGMRL